MRMDISGPPPDDTARATWNDRYSRAGRPQFRPHRLLTTALAQAGGVPRSVLELASGSSGVALELAAAGSRVTAVDISDVALDQLADEAAARDLAHAIELVQADLDVWEPGPDTYDLVLCIRFWSPAVFRSACGAVAPGGLLAWEALARGDTPPPVSRHGPGDRWRAAPGEPASLLPDTFEVLAQGGTVSDHGPSRWVVARRDER